jgi:hypothetical protein
MAPRLFDIAHPEFRVGMRAMAPQMPGLAAWGLMTGVAMVKSGLSLPEVLAMALLVYAGSAQLAALPFTPCGPTQPLSLGFVPPRGQAHGPLAEFVPGGHILLKLQFEQRLLPGSVVRERVDELAQKMEQETGRKAGAKRRRELKDEALLAEAAKARMDIDYLSAEQVKAALDKGLATTPAVQERAIDELKKTGWGGL